MGSPTQSQKAKRIAAIAGLILLTLIFVLLDLSISFGDRNSWANVFRVAFRTQPAVAWIVGVIIGHLYHPFGSAPFNEKLPAPWKHVVDPLGKWPMLRIAVAVGASTLIVALVSALMKALGAHLAVWPFGLAGIVFGAFIWPTSAAPD